MSDPMGSAPGAPSEDELRAAYEAELSRITATDMIAQSAVSLLNIGARRLGPPPGTPPQPGGEPDGGRDLEQARDAIDGARALLAILERRIPQELAPLRDALSRLQMAYAAEIGPAEGQADPGSAGAGAPPPQGGQAPPQGGRQAAPQAPDDGQGGSTPGPGPAESSGRLWVPGR